MDDTKVTTQTEKEEEEKEDEEEMERKENDVAHSDTNNGNAAAAVVKHEACARNANTLAQSQLKSPLKGVHPILPEANAAVSSLEVPPLEAQQTPEAPRLPSGQDINAKNTLQCNSVVAVEATVTATTTESVVPSDFYKQMHGAGGTRMGMNGMGIDVTVVVGVAQRPILSSQQRPTRPTGKTNSMYVAHPSQLPLSRPPHLPTSATSVSSLSAPSDSITPIIDIADTAIQLLVQAAATTNVTSRTVLPLFYDTTVFANACILEDEGSPVCEISQVLPTQLIFPNSTTVVTNANSRVSGLTNSSTVGVGLVKTQFLQQRRSVTTLALTLTALAVAVIILLTESLTSTTNDANQLLSGYIQNVTLSGRKITILSSGTPEAELAEEMALRWLMYEDPLALQPFSVTNRFRLRQRYALQTLFMQQHNDEQQRRFFTASTNECEWLGVKCEKRESDFGEGTFDVVTSIALPARQLSGTLPLDLGLLSANLVHLDVSHNYLYGSLPESLDQCSNLERIDLSYNRGFVGTIPRSWGTQWTNLRNFSIAESDLTGLLPPELGHWTLLTHFNVEHNKLTGPIPSVWGEQWTKLEYFSVGNSYRREFYRLNRLTGTIPETVSLWTNLRSFSVARNSLIGTLPNSLQQWTALEVFNVRNNLQFNGTLPAVYGTAWSSLQYADVSNNDFGGIMPESFSRWIHLEYLDIKMNQLTGTLSDTWAQWTNLRHMNIRVNQFRGSVPQVIGSAWSKLEFIDMGDNSLVGSLSESIGNWTSLLSFSADDNNLTGSLPSSIGQWVALTDMFNVDRNLLKGTLPDSIGQWSRLTFFTVSVNGFTGTIPKAVEGWTMIESLFIEANNFTGTMPDGICQTNVIVLVADCQDGITCSCCTLCNSTLD